MIFLNCLGPDKVLLTPLNYPQNTPRKRLSKPKRQGTVVGGVEGGVVVVWLFVVVRCVVVRGGPPRLCL